MPRMTRLLMAAAVLGWPMAAQAENASAADQRYCAQLSDLYVRYLGRAEGPPRTGVTPDVDGGVALAKCREGQPADAIPVLERKLRDAGFSLPPRG